MGLFGSSITLPPPRPIPWKMKTLSSAETELRMLNPFLRPFFNRIVRPRVFSDDKARTWLKHNVEEVGNFEFFLPDLHALEGGT